MANPEFAHIKAILFDKDGTLIDIENTWVPAVKIAAQTLEKLTGVHGLAQQALHDTGFDFTNDRFLPDSILASHSTLDLVRHWVGDHGGPDLIKKMQSVVAEAGIRHMTPLFNLPDLFKPLFEHQIDAGIATMDDEEVAFKTVERFEIADYVRFVVGFDSGHGEKPGPGMIDAFCAELQLEPGQIAMVGDTNHDLAMGQNAGAGLVVGVLSGSNEHEQLAERSDIVVNDARDLLKLLI